MGYVELDYSKIEDEVMTSLDLNDDGKVDSADILEIWNRTMKASVWGGSVDPQIVRRKRS